MKVAELHVTFGRHSFGRSSTAIIGFESAENAGTEFDRLADLIKRREDRANDLDKMVSVAGIEKFTCTLDEVLSIGLVDYVRVNETQAGVRDAFPHVFKL